MADEKARARALARAVRDRVDPALGEAVRARLLALLVETPGRVVSGWLAIGSELDVEPLLVELVARGRTVVLPAVVGSGRPLEFRRWAPGDPLVAEPFGTRAPGPDAPTLDPEVLLVPLLAFDRSGFRLGYGGGFYDRSLERLRRLGTVTAIGAGYAAQEVERVPRDLHDQPLDAWVTEQQVWRPGPVSPG